MAADSEIKQKNKLNDLGRSFFFRMTKHSNSLARGGSQEEAVHHTRCLLTEEIQAVSKRSVRQASGSPVPVSQPSPPPALVPGAGTGSLVSAAMGICPF